MAEIVDSDDTTCSTDEEAPPAEPHWKMTTLLDLQKRREALLAQKRLLLKRQRENTHNLAEVRVKTISGHPKAVEAVSNSTFEITAEVVPRAASSTGPEPISSEDKIMQCNAIFNVNEFQERNSALKSNAIEVENIENIDINNLPFMEIIDNQSTFVNDDSDLMDIPTNELINICPESNLVLLEDSSAIPATTSNSEPIGDFEARITVNSSIVEKSPDVVHMLACNIPEKPVSPPDEVTKNSQLSNISRNEAIISADQDEPINSSTYESLASPSLLPSTSGVNAPNSDGNNEVPYHGDLATDRKRPYDSRILEFSFFVDFSKDLIYKSIRPGRKANDPTVTDLKSLVYKPNGTIWYNLNFGDTLQPLPQRPMKINNLRSLRELPKLFSATLPISQRKYKDLQDLKAVLPSNCHSFYDDLPYKN